jgi:osmotically-inducible protein OsmY
VKRWSAVILMSFCTSLGAPLITGCRSAQQMELPAATRADDSRINAAVRNQLFADRALAAAYFDVTTREGVVTLSGRATSAEIARAVKIARDTRGVREVEDLINTGSRWRLTAKTR